MSVPPRLEGWWGRGHSCLLTPRPHTAFSISPRVYWPDSFRCEEHGCQLVGQPADPGQAALHPGHSLCTIDGPPAPFDSFRRQGLASWWRWCREAGILWPLDTMKCDPTADEG